MSEDLKGFILFARKAVSKGFKRCVYCKKIFIKGRHDKLYCGDKCRFKAGNGRKKR
jgi:hypothetical protein